MSESEAWEEEEEVPLTQNRKRNSGKSYTVKHKLKPPRTTTYSTQSLYDEIYEDNINLAPEYQRDVVWPPTKQMALIDSIYRNFYIPPIIFAVTTSDDGTEKKTCIDGKQRLSSIQRFMDGLIPVKEQDTERKFWYKGRNPYVGDSWRKTFAHRQIVCVEYVELSDADEREIFRRVQLGVALTPAEVMRAETHSPRVKLVQSIVDNQMLYLDKVFNMKRGAPFRWVTQSILTISTWSSGRHPATTADTLKKWIKEPDEPNSDMAQKIQDSYTILKDFVLDDKTFLNVTQGPKKIAPIDLPFMITFIYLFKDRFSKEQLSSGIKLMREIVRQEHTDILWNAKVLGTYVYFIDDFQVRGLHALENPLAPRTQHPQGLVANAPMKIDASSLPTPASSQASMPVLPIQHVQQSSQQLSYQPSQQLCQQPSQQPSQQSSQQVPLAGQQASGRIFARLAAIQEARFHQQESFSQSSGQPHASSSSSVNSPSISHLPPIPVQAHSSQANLNHVLPAQAANPSAGFGSPQPWLQSHEGVSGSGGGSARPSSRSDNRYHPYTPARR